MRRGMRQLAAGALAAAMLLCSGCKWDWGFPQKPITVPTPTVNYRPEYSTAWCYRSLPPRLQQMYDAVYTAVRECHTDTWVSIRGSEKTETDYIGLKVKLPVAITDNDEARRLFNAFTADNPQFFFIGNTYSYEGYRMNDVDYYDVFCLTLTMDADERQEASIALEKAVSELLATIPPDATAYETELLLHDALAARVTYDYETFKSARPAEYRPSAFSAYGALVEGAAVCEGYSRAMQLLLHRANIPCTLVGGIVSDGESHMWNLVDIDGRSYHVDLTWDDAEDFLNHTYFNITTEELLLTHTPDADNLGVDTCTAVEANYFVKENLLLDTYDRSIIAEAVARQVQKGADRVELRFSPNTFANAQLFFSNSRRLAQYVNPFLPDQTLWAYACQANETYHTLTIYKQES